MRWCAAILSISAATLFALSPHLSKEQVTPHPQNLYIALSRGAGHSYRATNAVDSRYRVIVYPYSVIPGGVESVEELKVALGRDPVAAREYAGFDLARARVVYLTEDRNVYLSYRLGDHIFWSTTRHVIRRGETVITDGKHMARTRCGNLVADVAMGPVSPNEPSEQILDAELPLDLRATPGSDLEIPTPDDWIPFPLILEPVADDPGNSPSVFQPPSVIGDGSIPLDNPGIPTPEPGILVLLFAGIGVLLVLQRMRRARHLARIPKFAIGRPVS